MPVSPTLSPALQEPDCHPSASSEETIMPPIEISHTPYSPSQTATNTHYMVTHAKSGIFNPKAYVTTSSDYINVEPPNFRVALKCSHWCKDMQDEYDTLLQNNTWELVPRPSNKKVIGCKWMFRIKRNSD